MTMDSSDPVGLRHRLRIQLRQLREAAGLSQQGAAAALTWEPVRLLAVETGADGVEPGELDALLTIYGPVEAAAAATMRNWAELSRHLPTSGYQSVPASTLKFWNLRSRAIRVRQLETTVIPGLLQTEEYAREVIRAYSPSRLPEAAIENRVRARMDQRSLLDREDRPDLFFMIDEAALRRQVGGPEVMRRQLDHLKQQAGRPRLDIQILPFELGAHRGLCGPFQILEFQEDGLVLYLDDVTGGKTTRDMEAEALDYLAVFWGLESAATAPRALAEVVDRVREGGGPAAGPS